MTAPAEEPRDPDLDVLPFIGYRVAGGTYIDETGVHEGIRLILDTAEVHIAGSLTVEGARDLAHALYHHINHINPVTPVARPTRLSHWLTGAKRGADLDPKTCSGCGVVVGKQFVARHHPTNCPERRKRETEQPD